MNIRKLINSCAFDLPVSFPVPMTGLELLSDLLPFYISLSCYITSTLPFYNSSKFYFVIRGVLFIFICKVPFTSFVPCKGYHSVCCGNLPFHYAKSVFPNKTLQVNAFNASGSKN